LTAFAIGPSIGVVTDAFQRDLASETPISGFKESSKNNVSSKNNIHGRTSMTGRFLRIFLACVAACAFSGASAQAQAPNLETMDVMIPSGDAGIQLFVRNKHPAGKENFSADKILLFVHGATYPAETAFDLPIEGASMMDLIAGRGYDVYLVDVRGYGRSTRPDEMSEPPAANKPIVSTKVAAHDLGAAVDYILKKRSVAKINVMGWSWGTSIAGMYTSENNSKVNRLVLYAPQWIRTEPPAPVAANAPPLGAYRLVSKESAKARWLKGVSEEKQADLIPPGVFDAWADATWATDTEASRQNPPMLRAPNGVVEDSMNYWSAGKAQYDPGKIMVPTFLLHAEWDADLPSYLAQGYFAQLKNAPYKRLVELSEGTHTVMMEKNRMQFFHELMGFLDEEKPLALR
jgi:pimeloyl-ACP methyl ester carboxylesterase